MKKLLLLGLAILVFLACTVKEEPKPEPPKPEPTIFKGTFLEVLKEATKMVITECPQSKLFEADAAVAEPGMTVSGVKGWRFVYYFPENKTAFISYKDSTFSNVSVVDDPWFDDCIIRDLKMDLPEAIELMRKANYNDKFVDLTVRRPLHPGCKEPYYIFSCPELGWVFVGTNSKKVTLEPFK